MQHKCLGHLLAIVPLSHLWQNHEALLALLDKTVKRVMVERVVLYALTDPAHLHHQGRVADSALQQNLYQLTQEGLYLVNCLIAISAANAQGINDGKSVILQLLLLGYLRGNTSMVCLESLSQHVHNRPLQRVQAAHFTQGFKSRRKMRIDQSCRCLKGLQVEVENALYGEFFWSEKVEELIKAVAFVEFCNFVGEFVAHGEVRGGIVKSSDHMAQVVLQGEHLSLQSLVLLHQSLFLLFHIGQFANQQLHLPAQVPSLS